MKDIKTVYHIVSGDLWSKSLEIGEYKCESLEKEGFIHFSLVNQVLETANRHYHGTKGLVLLQINPERLSTKLKFEIAPWGESFPHLYGPLNLDAVEKAFEFAPDSNGDFVEIPS
jgi:uncharacterized protein (DUF952 family)